MGNDFLKSYKIDHDVDMCAELAFRADGLVATKDRKVMAKTACFIWLTPPTSYSYKVGKCEKFVTHLGRTIREQCVVVIGAFLDLLLLD